MSALDNVRVVLVEPQDPVNIAAVVRAMKNMGVEQLRLVNSVEYDASRVERVAHDPRDLDARSRHCATLAAATRATPWTRCSWPSSTAWPRPHAGPI